MDNSWDERSMSPVMSIYKYQADILLPTIVMHYVWWSMVHGYRLVISYWENIDNKVIIIWIRGHNFENNLLSLILSSHVQVRFTEHLHFSHVRSLATRKAALYGFANAGISALCGYFFAYFGACHAKFRTRERLVSLINIIDLSNRSELQVSI